MLPLLVTVNLGDYDLANSSESINIQRLVAEIKMHPEYNGNDFDNDIALLKFISPVAYTDTIQPACIPPPNLDLAGKVVMVTGWGRTEQGGASSPILLDVALHIISNKDCQKFYNSTGVTITPRMICAGELEGGKDSCQGDSGGPMQFQCEQDVFSIAGIVSFGKGCALPDSPGVYTRVSEFIPWIEEETGSETCSKGCGGTMPEPVEDS